MSPEQQQIWERVKRFELDDPQAQFSFTDRLARENGWKLEFALRTVLEYKRFMFLASISPVPLTPSDQVDQVWHLHLIYTESYWEKFCQQALPRPVKHGPTKGGKQEGDKFTNWYEHTKQYYQEIFGHLPPPDIWPPSEVRFGQLNFQRVNMDDYWLFPKPKWLRKWKFWKN